MMKETYSIGEQKPWRLTRESGYRLALAICQSGAEVVSAAVDRTCPPTHVSVRLRVEKSNADLFFGCFREPVGIVETAGGAARKQNEKTP